MVLYKLIERVDPRDPTLPRKFYAQLVSGDDVSFDDLVETIGKMSNLNYGDIVGVLGALIMIIEEQLKYGRPVRLGALGKFYLSLSSSGTDTAEAFTEANIRDARILFYPGRKLKKLLNQLDFQKENGNGDQNGQSNDAKADVEPKKKDA
jgi:predicted histone-like DNA-binding protein